MADILTPLAPGSEKCTMCGKEFAKDTLVVKDGDLCPECRKTYGDMAFLFCCKCDKIVARIPPGMAMGIMIKPGDILHVEECPQCTPGVVKSIPVEVRKK